MTPFWSPQSVVLIPDTPPTIAHPIVLKMILAPGRPVELLYAGDRMWPSIRHGQTVVVEPLGHRPVEVGSIVLACPAGIPDLLRVARITGSTALLRGDSDAKEKHSIQVGDLLARAQLPAARVSQTARTLRRLWLDAKEAWSGLPDSLSDPAGTVRTKYDAQAPFYAGVENTPIADRILETLHKTARPGGRILVAGSGSGRESLMLARLGWKVVGIDFSATMVEYAHRLLSKDRELASRLEFLHADLTTHDEPHGSLAGIYFTYDVYSFIPDAERRIALLQTMSRWLEEDAPLLLSARRVGGSYRALVLALQRLARGRSPRVQGGDSHTRWITPDGALRRSFIHVFSARTVRREAAQAGFRTEAWIGNHCLLTRQTSRGRGTG